MARSCVLVVSVVWLLVGCSHDWTDREYCVRRQMAWESAFPELPQTETQRVRFVDACIAATASEHVNGRLDRSIDCMKQFIHGKGHAHEEYLQFAECEGSEVPAH